MTETFAYDLRSGRLCDGHWETFGRKRLTSVAGLKQPKDPCLHRDSCVALAELTFHSPAHTFRNGDSGVPLHAAFFERGDSMLSR